MKNKKAKHLNQVLMLMAVLAVCFLCPSGVQKAAAAGSSRVNPAENALIGLFSIEDWYKEIKIPITSNYVAPNVNEFMNVRKEPSIDSEIVGKLRKNSYAKIVERLDEWTKITSGNVTGYVRNDYLYMDEAALEYFEENNAFQVIIRAGSMNVRCKPNTNAIH